MHAALAFRCIRLILPVALFLLLSLPVQAQSNRAAAFADTHPAFIAQGPPGSLLDRLPFLLGYERPMNYLILFQITDELRPSGGFIKFIIFVRLENGRPVEVRPHSIETLEPPGRGAFDWVQHGIRTLPPEPVENYLGLGNWVIRDSNWWGDFRDSAAQVVSFWTQAGFEPVDGVFAVNDTGIATLIDVVGGVQLPTGEMLTGANFKQYAIDTAYAGNLATWSERQQAAANNMVNAFMGAALNLADTQSPLVFLAAYNQLLNHNILVNVFDPATAQALNDLGIDGSLRADNQTDYFYFVEANVSYSKSSPFIERHFAYSAALADDGTLTSQLTVTLYNGYSRDRRLAFPAFYYEGMRWNPETRAFYRSEGYYGAYERVYLPANAAVLNILGFDSDAESDVYDPSPLTVVGGYVGLEAGESQVIQVQWSQAQADLIDGQYRLYVQRQPGLLASLSVEMQYPACAGNDTAAEAPAVQRWDDELSLDLEFEVDISCSP